MMNDETDIDTMKIITAAAAAPAKKIRRVVKKATTVADAVEGAAHPPKKRRARAAAAPKSVEPPVVVETPPPPPPAPVVVSAPLPPRITPDYLARENPHERDPYITFDEGPHEYTVRGEKGYTSVTTWNHMLFEAFDEEKMIQKILKNRQWRTDETYKYYKKSAEEIREMWRVNRDSASGAGTQLHYNIECFYNKIPVENDSIEYKYFLQFVADYPNLEAYRTEWCVYYEELKLSGSIDMVFRDRETGEFYIYDWKRSKEISFESWGGKTSPVACISHLPDCNFWHYSLQLNTYRAILEAKYGLRISGMFLICIHPDNPYGTYERIEVHDLRREVAELFEFRRKLLLGEVSLAGAH